MIQAVIAKRFDSGFSLSVELEAPAGVTVLFGPSGAGKTLTLDCLAGFAEPDRGRITLDGRLLFDAEARLHVPPRSRTCGYVFQDYALFPHMSVRANLAFAAHNLPRLERHRRIADLLDRFRIADLAGRFPHELSGGQKQRASIARALINDPKFLLLDEPGRGLDAALRSDLHLLIGELRGSVPVPILLVTHDVEECFSVADQVLIYEGGQVMHRGAPSDLLRNPGTAKVAEVLGGFNVYDAEVLFLDPSRQISRIRMLGHEMNGPHLRGVFKGDRIKLAIRPEELRIASKPGDNRIRADVKSLQERPQSVLVNFGEGLLVDTRRDEWQSREETLWVEIPATQLKQLSR